MEKTESYLRSINALQKFVNHVYDSNQKNTNYVYFLKIACASLTESLVSNFTCLAVTLSAVYCAFDCWYFFVSLTNVKLVV